MRSFKRNDVSIDRLAQRRRRPPPRPADRPAGAAGAAGSPLLFFAMAGALVNHTRCESGPCVNILIAAPVVPAPNTPIARNRVGL